MRSTIELYGINPQYLADTRYKEALTMCKKGAQNRLQQLMQSSYLDRDERLIYDINKAFEWCNNKLLELEKL